MYKLTKSLGQNLLVSSSVKNTMVDSINILERDLVVEIGAGLGALTKVLLTKADIKDTKFFIIEYDQRFIAELGNLCKVKNNFEIINANILDWLPNLNPERSFKVIGSLPYYITSPIIHKIIKHPSSVSSCVFLMQKEVAHKIIKKEPDHSYLSVFVQSFYDVKIIRDVPARFFRPIPKVDSSVIKFDRKNNINMKQDEIFKYEKFLHKAFSSPRKMLNKVFPKEILNSVGIDEKMRPQNINIEKWVELFNRVRETTQ